MKKFILLACLCYSFTCLTQKPPIKFGDIPLEDLKMTVYDKDSSAAAVVLADYGESSLVYNQQSGFALLFERIIRIKILTTEGLEWANFSIPLYHAADNNEKVMGLKAVTYNLENGKVVETKMKNDEMIREKVDQNLDFVKVPWPNVKAGSVIEITYKVDSDFIFNFQDWEFQRTIPARWSEYRTKIPEYFNYEKYVQGYIPMAISESTSVPSSITIYSKERNESTTGGPTTFYNDKLDFQEYRNRWVAQDVPAFKAEPYLTTYKDYISKINFELSSTRFPNQPFKNYMGSWEEINKTYAESDDFGAEVTGNGFLKKTVEEITLGINSTEEKVRAIHHYVRDNIIWDGSTRKFINTPLRKVMEEKKGSSAEINLLLASMLEKAGVAVYPVLISTRDHGFIREFIPVSSQFNNVVCLAKFDDKQILLDATDKLLPTGMLPERCLNGSGLVVSKDGPSWVSLAASKSKSTVNYDLLLSATGELKGKMSFDNSGYYARQKRQQYLSKGEDDYLKAIANNYKCEVAKSEFQNAKGLNEPFKESYELTLSDHTNVAADMIYFSPFLVERLEENPFRLEKREYPVDFGSPFDKLHFIKITIPDNYKIEEFPKSKMFMLPGNIGKYAYNISQAGNSISIFSSFQINRSLYTQQEYPALREFYNQVVAKQAEQIVLKKK